MTETLYIGEAPPSPAGPADPGDALHEPPTIALPRALQTLRFTQRQIQFVSRARRELGDVFSLRFLVIPGGVAVTSHPDHVRSLFTAKPELVPSLTAESPLRPVLGPGSVLTANGPSHLRQRKPLLPPFHGDAIVRYRQMISDAAEREIARWPVGGAFALAPRMQAITLDVILAGIFGVESRPRLGTPEHALRFAIRELLRASTMRAAKLAELTNIGRDEPFGLTKLGLLVPDRCVYALIAKRRHADDLEQRHDILSLLLAAKTEDGRPLSDRALRDELMTLVLAGHETTANQLAWTWERLVRSPAAYERLREAVRSGTQTEAEEHVEATIVEGMRSRPVIPIIGRRVTVPWRLGEYVVPAQSAISMSILLVHHREDLYPDPYAFRPERWLGHRGGRAPNSYEWLPFGGGTRRCLGAALAMAEQRIVLEAMVRRLDLEADRPEPEHAQHRNVTMIPARGARVLVRGRRG